MREIFGMAADPPWPALAIFDDEGHCVAGLQHARLGLSRDGETRPVEALRNVCVAPAARGRGLMRRLMDHVLARCDADAVPTLLYAEEPDLYARFGFAPVMHHAFEGPAPTPEGAATPVVCVDDMRLKRLVATRAAVSWHCDLADDGGLRLHRLRRPDGLDLRYLEWLDAIVAVEREGETLVLVDVVAPRMPRAAELLGALGERPRHLRTLFPPDRLGWSGKPVAEDTGLMARGLSSDALRPPFMLPPTVEF